MATLARLAMALILSSPALARAENGDWWATVYGARISTQPGWEDIIVDPPGTEFVDSYLLAAALSRRYAQRVDGALTLEAEGQVVRHFHDQTHWELHAIPSVVRWNRSPCCTTLATPAAYARG